MSNQIAPKVAGAFAMVAGLGIWAVTGYNAPDNTLGAVAGLGLAGLGEIGLLLSGAQDNRIPVRVETRRHDRI